MTAPETSLFINRELSWLEFNRRVLHEALDPRVPLLERLKFLGIHANNLDEFYMVRVAGLRRQAAAGVTQTPADGLTPQEQLAAIAEEVADMTRRARRCLTELLEALGKHEVRILRVRDLSPSEWGAIDEYFEQEVFPVLTPLAVDPGHPFPYISNLSLSLAVEVRDPETGTDHFARVKVPRILPRWVPVPGRPHHVVPLEEVIGANLGALFSGMEIRGWYPFRVTRYSDLELTGVEPPEDLLVTIEEEIFKRRFGEVVRLEVDDRLPAGIRTLLLEELSAEEAAYGMRLTPADIQDAGAILDLGDLLSLASLVDLPELKYPPHVPAIPDRLRDDSRSIFDVLREGDVLVHHPWESFSSSVERFLETAALDEQVLAIKLTLYRTSGDTPIVHALTAAAQRGKQVAVIVELKARFDETNNIQWARTLESFGVHVAYGSAELKTHAKLALVVRREADGIRRYVHVGTGNYNTRTARQYTDVGLLSASPSLGADVSDLFNSLTGFSRRQVYRKLIVAPASMRRCFVALVEREAAHAREGRPGRIVAKMNSLVDPTLIEALYAASASGVEIDLIVRGICCLRPGLPGLSERIRVRSIVGRFLEHSRIWYFGNAGRVECYIGSADWMPRNFDRRLEAVVPVEDPVLRNRLRCVLVACLDDDRNAWDLHPDGRWTQRQPAGEPVSVQELLAVDPWASRYARGGDALDVTVAAGIASEVAAN
ncbi:MAG: polyphosphate kinase 1 [Gemmatimonadaceae bacterium]